MRDKYGPGHRLALVAGTASEELAQKIAKKLQTRLILRDEETQFRDGETRVEIDECVRGKDVFVIQSVAPPAVNDNLMELVLLSDAIRRSDARRTNAVVPYLGYARQDRRPKRTRTPVSARVVADMIQNIAGYKRTLTVDIHAEQIQGFFRTGYPFINAGSSPLFIADIYRRFMDIPVIVSPDAGGAERTREVAKKLGADLAVIDKRRPKHGVSKVMNILFDGDLTGRTCILLDDLVDSGGTLIHGAEALLERGAAEVHAYCTHPVLSGNAVRNINASHITTFTITDTIAVGDDVKDGSAFRILSMAEILAETIRRVHNRQSVSAIYAT